ncbi:MAG: hypothetical protein ACRC33_28400 [Gemmataceae bacterium]
MTTQRFRLALLLPLAALIAGCGSNLGQVTGTVTYEGTPLADGTIIFETTGARPATGKIVAGKITDVMTSRPGDGVPPGSHKVAIHAIEAAGSAVAANPGDKTGIASMQTKSLIPAKYGDPATSGLTAEIKPGSNELKFELKKNP